MPPVGHLVVVLGELLYEVFIGRAAESGNKKPVTKDVSLETEGEHASLPDVVEPARPLQLQDGYSFVRSDGEVSSVEPVDKDADCQIISSSGLMFLPQTKYSIRPKGTSKVNAHCKHTRPWLDAHPLPSTKILKRTYMSVPQRPTSESHPHPPLSSFP